MDYFTTDSGKIATTETMPPLTVCHYIFDLKNVVDINELDEMGRFEIDFLSLSNETGTLNVLLKRIDNTYLSFKYGREQLLPEGLTFTLQKSDYVEIIYETLASPSPQAGIKISWSTEIDDESEEIYAPSLSFVIGVVGGVLFLFVFCT
jgi:hypothetical protein